VITSQELAFVRLAMRRRLVTANLVREAVERKKWDDPDRPLPSILVDMGALQNGQADELRRALKGGERAEADRRAKATMVAVDPNVRGGAKETADAAGAPLETVGKYKLVRLLGAGAMGAVYMAEHTELRRQVALKLLMSEGAPSPRAIARFRREARLAARLDHPNVVRVYEAGLDEGQHFIAMDMVAGRSVAELIALNEVSPRRAVHITRKAAEATHYAHQQGVIHRDLKPANILVDESTGEPRVTDFGLATMSEPEEDDRLTRTGAAVGTPAYMAPEQVRGQLDRIDARTDVYALGATLYEMLTGRPPFEAETFLDLAKKICDREPVAPRKRNSRVPVDVETICLKALEKAPRDRYQTAEELAVDLAAYLEDAPIVAQPPSTFTVARRWARRRPAVVATIFGLVGVLCGALTFHFTRPGYVELYSRPAGATVLVDGTPVGQTSDGAALELELPAGRHELRFALEGYLDTALHAESVEVGHGKTHTLTGTLISKQGTRTLRVVSDPPGARVSIRGQDGEERDVGRTDFLTSLSAGSYRVVVVEPPPGYVSPRPEQMAEIVAGSAPLKVECELVPDEGLLYLETDPPDATFRDARGHTGVTPAEILGAGRHDLEISRAGFLTRAFATEVPGEPVRERVSLAPAVEHRRLLEGRLRAAPLLEDLDGDGSRELIALERGLEGGTLAVYPGGGQAGTRYRVACEATRLVGAVDLDRDGVLDLVLGGRDQLELRDGESGRLLVPAVAVNAHGVALDVATRELIYVAADGKLVATPAHLVGQRAGKPNGAVDSPPAVLELRADDRVAAFPLSDGKLRVQPTSSGAPRDLPVPGLRWKSRVQRVVVKDSHYPWVLAVPPLGPAQLVDPKGGTVHTVGDPAARILEALSVQAGGESWLFVSSAQGCVVYNVDAKGVQRLPDVLPRRPRQLEDEDEDDVVWTPAGDVFRLKGRQWVRAPGRSSRNEALIDVDGPAVVADLDGDGVSEVVASAPDRRALVVLSTGGEALRWRQQLASPALAAMSLAADGGDLLVASGDRVMRFATRDGRAGAELETGSDVLALASLASPPQQPGHLAVATRDERVRLYQASEEGWVQAWETSRATPVLVAAGEDVDGDGVEDVLAGRPLALLGSKTGKPVWAEGADSAKIPLRGVLRVGGERSICVGASGSAREPGLIARTPQGEQLWRAPLSAQRAPYYLLGADDLDVVVAVTDSATSIPYRHELVAFARRDGEVRWRKEKLPGQAASVQGVVIGGDEARLVLTVQPSPREHELVCLDAGTGQVLWAHMLPRPTRARSAPSAPVRLTGQAGRRSDDVIAVVAPSGVLLLYALTDGRLLGERRVDEGFEPHLLVTQGSAEALVSLTEQGRLQAATVSGPEGREAPTRREAIREQLRVLALGREALERPALNELSALQEAQPKDPVATLALARAYLRQGRWKESRQRADEARRLLAQSVPTRVADCLSIATRARFEESRKTTAVSKSLDELAGLDPLRAAETAMELVERIGDEASDDAELAQQVKALRQAAVRYLREATARDPGDGRARGRLGELLLTWPGFARLDWKRPEPEAFVRGRNQASAARVELLLALNADDEPRTQAGAILALCLERQLTLLFRKRATSPAHIEAEKNRLATIDRLLTALTGDPQGGLLEQAAAVAQAAQAERPLPRGSLRQIAQGKRGLVPAWRVTVEALERSGSR
jgi:serine/threonine protein kinase/outer membrane protein assembly factor BamB